MMDDPVPPPMPQFRAASFDDLKRALRQGLADFLKHPLPGLFFAAVYVGMGYAVIFGLVAAEQVWMSIPFLVAFPIIAPFAAAGIYDVSRRIQAGDPVSLRAAITTAWQQRARDLGWMAFTVLFIFWIWIYQVRLLLALFLSRMSFSDLDSFTTLVFQTQQGWGFLVVGTLVGAVLSTVLFSLTFIAMPLLMDEDIDFITAMIASVQTVLKSPVVLLAWGAFLAIVLLISMLPALLGLMLSLPILGHATWRLYTGLRQ